jgi:hypothetical protein
VQAREEGKRREGSRRGLKFRTFPDFDLLAYAKASICAGMDDIQQLSSARRPQKTYKRGRHALRRHQSRSSPVINSGRSTQPPSASDGPKKRARTRSRDGVERFNSPERDSAVQKPTKRSRHSRNSSRQILASVAQVENHLPDDNEPLAGAPARDLEVGFCIFVGYLRTVSPPGIGINPHTSVSGRSRS